MLLNFLELVSGSKAQYLFSFPPDSSDYFLNKALHVPTFPQSYLSMYIPVQGKFPLKLFNEFWLI